MDNLEHSLSKGQTGAFGCPAGVHEYVQPSNVDNLTKLALIDEKELGHKVTEIRENINRSICQDIINIYGMESVLPEDTAKKGILGVIPILSFFSTMALII